MERKTGLFFGPISKKILSSIKNFESHNDHFEEVKSSLSRSDSIVWILKNLPESISPDQKEMAIQFYDKIPNSQNFGVITQKLILVSCLRLSLKLNNFNLSNFDWILVESEKRYDSKNPQIDKKDISNCEIYICNILKWEFNMFLIYDYIKIFIRMNNIMDGCEESFLKIVNYFHEISLVCFKMDHVPLHSVALSIILLSFDQISFPQKELMLEEFICYVHFHLKIDILRVDNYKKLMKEYIEMIIPKENRNGIELVQPDLTIIKVLNNTNQYSTLSSIGSRGNYNGNKNSIKIIRKTFEEKNFDEEYFLEKQESVNEWNLELLKRKNYAEDKNLFS